MPDLNQHQGQPQGQNGPFGAKDREKRAFGRRKFDASPNGENVTYDVLLDEKNDGSVETTHFNGRVLSENGYEISPPPTPESELGLCRQCKDTMPAGKLKECNACGKRLCPTCRVLLFWKFYYCKWKCAALAIVIRIIKIPLQDIYKG